MGIIWLMIKLILWTVLGCATFIISAFMLILLMPIRYEVYLEKYDVLNYEIKLKYLPGVRGYFFLQEGMQSNVISIFGKQVYASKNDANKQEDADQIKDKNVVVHVKEKGDCKKEPSKHSLMKAKTHGSNQKIFHKEKSTLVSEDQVQTNKVAKRLSSDGKVKEKEEVNKGLQSVKTSISQMRNAANFIPIVKSVVKLIKSLIRYIGPREWSFELVIGREDPADTGELMAKLIMLYPWYYQHGSIEGNYETAGIWGGFLAQGKFRIGGVLTRIIAFLWYRPVRQWIKHILSQRKEEKHGK